MGPESQSGAVFSCVVALRVCATRPQCVSGGTGFLAGQPKLECHEQLTVRRIRPDAAFSSLVDG